MLKTGSFIKIVYFTTKQVGSSVPPTKSGIIQSQSVVLYFVRAHPETHDLVMGCHSLDFWTCDKFSTTNYAGGIIHKPSGLIVAEIYL